MNIKKIISVALLGFLYSCGGGGGDSNHLSTRTGGMGGPGIVIIAYDA